MIITIDGPSGSGKSTIAKKVSEKLGFEYLDTGAMYRSITLFLLENGVDIKNEKETENFVNRPSFTSSFDLKQENSKIFINNNDVSEKIREPIITDNVSQVSSYGFVRELLVDKQRKMSKTQDLWFFLMQTLKYFLQLQWKKELRDDLKKVKELAMMKYINLSRKETI